MIVAMDIGNTNIKAAVFEGSRLVKRWRCATDSAMTSDQYGIIMADLFRYHNLNMQAVEGIMISSVVPTINYTIEHMCRDYFHLEPRLLVPGMKTGLNIRYENPRELGSDRIANAVAVSTLYGGPSIFIDFGTATTYGVVSAKAEFLGGAIGPGLRMMNRALSTGTAKLPSIELVLPPPGHRQDDGIQYSGRHPVRLHRFGRKNRRADEAGTGRREYPRDCHRRHGASGQEQFRRD